MQTQEQIVKLPEAVSERHKKHGRNGEVAMKFWEWVAKEKITLAEVRRLSADIKWDTAEIEAKVIHPEITIELH